MPVSIIGNSGIQFPDSSLQTAAASPYVLKNRIINGDMRIDQRNAGASVTPANTNYTLDRWVVGTTQASKFSVQQNAGSVTPPASFSNYLGITSLSAYSVASTDEFEMIQWIEGFNFADLDYGKATAKTITLSFWVRSSLTGTFGGSLCNSAFNRSYVFNYTISSANTWQQVSITIAGDTSGTWIGSTNGQGIGVIFSIGAGSSRVTTAGAWNSAFYVGPTGQTSVVGTNGATFYITGVQLEQNTSATPFERRLYNQELANCQRYCQVYINSEATNQRHSTTGWATGTTNVDASFLLKATMRTSPSVSIDTIGNLRLSDATAVTTASSYAILSSVTNSNQAIVGFGSSGLTTYRNYWVEANGTMNSAKITFSAEL
jgi:hypothetical protein